MANGQEYFKEKAKLASKYVGYEVEPKVLIYAFNVTHDDKKRTKQEAMEFVQERKNRLRKYRGEQSVEFLKQVNFFLNKISNTQLKKLFDNPKKQLTFDERLNKMFINRFPDLDEFTRIKLVKGIRNIAIGCIKGRVHKLL